ncbi:MAG: hypothetical protein ACREB5_08045 [Sphingomonadaceae bacterium]
MSWFFAAPLWFVGTAIFAALLIGVELGYRGQRFLIRRRAGEDVASGGQEHLLAAVLGLLALLLGFTFSLALDRYETRRHLVVQEANAIGTAWLRTQLIDEPDRSTLSTLLRAYVDARIAYSETDSPANASADLKRAGELQKRIWAVAGDVIRDDRESQLSRALIDPMNDAFDLASARTAERSAHIPGRVLGTLMLYAVLSAVMVGYILAGGGRRHRTATALTLVLLTLALVMILDLDRPRGGAIMVSQQPLEDLKAGF